jgi:hypothetical protein
MNTHNNTRTFISRYKFDREIAVCDGQSVKMHMTTDFKTLVPIDYNYGSTYEYLAAQVFAPLDTPLPVRARGRVAILRLDTTMVVAFTDALDRGAFLDAADPELTRLAIWVEKGIPDLPMIWPDRRTGNAILFAPLTRTAVDALTRIDNDSDVGLTPPMVQSLIAGVSQ